MKSRIFLLLKVVLLGLAIYTRYFTQWIPPGIPRNIYVTSIRLLMILLVFSITFGVIRLVYRSRNRVAALINDNFIIGLRNIFMVASGFAVLISFFGIFGIDFKTLFTTLSIVAAAIAIITKEFVTDLIVGIYLGFSQDIEIDDYVRLADQKGKIVEIGLLKLKLLDDNDDVLIFPNSKVYSNEIINYTKRDINLMSIDFQIDINRVTTIEDLEENLVHSLDSVAEYIIQDSFNLKIIKVKKDCLDVKFQYKLINLDREMHRRVRKKTVRQALSYITDNPIPVQLHASDD